MLQVNLPFGHFDFWFRTSISGSTLRETMKSRIVNFGLGEKNRQNSNRVKLPWYKWMILTFYTQLNRAKFENFLENFKVEMNAADSTPWTNVRSPFET